MIVFLNFAPFRFMGGAEKWAYETALAIAEREHVLLLSVSEKIANKYARLVLKRNFDIRANRLGNKEIKEKTIELKSFIPFSKSYNQIRGGLKKAERIYLKFEILELLIVMYFGGLNVLKKTIAGIHTPFLYTEPVTFFDKLHNTVYGSFFCRKILATFYKVHVITKRDYELFTGKMSLFNVVLVPNSMDIQSSGNWHYTEQSGSNLRVVFVGELIPRKGVDILEEVIKRSGDDIQFQVVGNGPEKDKVEYLSRTKENCKFYDYLDREDLFRVYLNSDILFLPSRAEGFPLVFVEALAHGLNIVTSNNAAVGLPDGIEYSVPNKAEEYLKVFRRIKPDPEKRKRIHKYFENNMSFSENKKQLIKEVFS